MKKKARSKKAKAAAPKKTRAPAPARAPTSGACRFVCSECYAEFLLPANFSKDTLTCPECLHVGKRPKDDFLRTVLIHKGQEKKSFALTAFCGVLFFAVSLFLVWKVSPYAGEQGAADNLPTILLGVSAALLVVFLILLARYEGNRWEVYF